MIKIFKKIDEYIIKKYIRTFLFNILVFSLIAVIIDMSEKIEKFIEEPCTLNEILFDYYLSFIFWINGLLTPLYAMISVIFFTSRMAYNSEIISILNAGMSFRRILKPYFIAGLLIATFHLFAGHFIIPNTNENRLKFEHAYIFKNSDKGKTNNVHLYLDQNTKIYIESYQKYDSIARDVQIEFIKDSKRTEVLSAKKAVWVGPPGKWRLTDYTIRRFDGLKEELIIEREVPLDTTLNLTPSDFIRYSNQKEMMNTKDLLSFIKNERKRGAGNTEIYEIELHRRSAEPFTILILTIIGAAVAARKVRGGIGLHLAIGLTIGAGYIILSRFANVFAASETLNPFLGVWIPNIIFTIVSIWLVYKAQR